jgi:eukaryotic-like serine/threonine-protein kinase
MTVKGSKLDLGDTNPLPKASDGRSDETKPISTSSDPAQQSAAGSAAGSEGTKAGEASKSGTNVDTILGRLVIDQGLATEDEVKHCLAQSKSLAEEQNQRSLADLLVDNSYVTSRQIARLREIVAAERSDQKIPGYKVLSRLGAGAMATVYRAKQLSLDRHVAIKVLPRKFSSNPQFIERFYAEGRAAAQLNHPNIVQAYDVGKAGDFHYFVMEFVDGSTVYDQIVAHRRYSESDAIDIAIQIAEALLHAHEKGLVHRDVKPKNIMVTKSGVAKLADLGLARAISDREAAEAEAGKAFGTPYYISPEQVRGEINVGAPADIYSLGATLYHMLTGSVPFDGKNPSAVMHKHLKADLVPPDHVNQRLSGGISEIIEMMMAKNPRERYQTCKDLLIDLRAVKTKQSPPIAHRGFAEVELASLAKAEAAAVGEMAQDKTPVPMVRRSYLLALAIALGVSLVGNVVLLLM